MSNPAKRSTKALAEMVNAELAKLLDAYTTLKDANLTPPPNRERENLRVLLHHSVEACSFDPRITARRILRQWFDGGKRWPFVRQSSSRIGGEIVQIEPVPKFLFAVEKFDLRGKTMVETTATTY